jgi:hypothetical protein
LNFGDIAGTNGYGIRDNGGTLQLKNTGGSWTNIPTSGGCTPTGSNIYYNTGKVGIGTTTPISNLTISAPNVAAPATADSSNNAGLTIVGSSQNSRLQFGLGNSSLGNTAAWIQASFDNGGGFNGVVPLFLQPLANRSGTPEGVTVGTTTLGFATTLSVTGLGTGTGKTFQLLNANNTANVTVLDNGKIGIGTTTPSALLTVQGTDTASTTAFNVINSAGTTVFAVFDNGNSTYSGSIFQSSDQRLKTNVSPLTASSSLAAIEALNPVSYTRIDEPENGTNLGFLAQEVQQVFPELVSLTTPSALTPGGTLNLNYVGLIAPMVGAIKDLATEVSSLAQTVSGFGQKFTTHELCVDDVCVTRDQFLRMVEQSGQTPTAPAAVTSTADQSEQGSAPAQTTDATATPAALDTTTASTTSAADASGQGTAATQTTDASSSPSS